MKKPTGADGKVTILIENIYFSFFEAPPFCIAERGASFTGWLKGEIQDKDGQCDMVKDHWDERSAKNMTGRWQNIDKKRKILKNILFYTICKGWSLIFRKEETEGGSIPNKYKIKESWDEE